MTTVHQDPAPTPAVQALLDELSGHPELYGIGVGILRIVRLTEAGDRAVQELAEVVLSEPFVAQKLICSANIVLNRRGIAPVTTISKAIVLLGLNQVRILALSTLLVDRLANTKQAQRVHEEFSKALYAATLARELAVACAIPEPEEAAVCALFRGLGRLVAVLYLYEPYEEARRLSWQQGLSVRQAALRTLGITYAELGVEVLKRWGMPERILQASMPCPDPLPSGATPAVAVRLLAEFCVELTEAASERRLQLRERQAEYLIQRFAEALGLSRARLSEALRRTDTHSQDLAHALGLPNQMSAGDLVDDTNPLTLSPVNRPSPELTLGVGIASVSKMLEHGTPARVALMHAAGILQRAFDFQRVVICLRDRNSAAFNIDLVAGAMPHASTGQFEIQSSGGHDLFQIAAARHADVYIRDATDPKLQASLPQWFKAAFPDAKSFLLLPVADAAGLIGFFYADHKRSYVQGLTAEEMRLLKALKHEIQDAMREEQAAFAGASHVPLPLNPGT